MNTPIARTFVLLFVTAAALHAQEPVLINYQGRVVVGGVNFDGSGLFKFAIVDAGGTTSYWSNDGTSTEGSEPADAVTLTVTDGQYSVLLGDTSLPNMAAIPAGIFDKADVFLRVWFDDGVDGSQLVTPDQSLRIDCTTTNASDAWQQRNVEGTAPRSRVYHSTVWTGSEMIVWGGILGGNTGDRYNPVTNTWTPVSTVGAPAQRYYHPAVWTGSEMIVWGGFQSGAGGNKDDGGRYNPAENRWKAVSTTGAPAARREHSAVWTGSEMIVWGGIVGSLVPFSYIPDCEAYRLTSAFRITNAVLDSGNLILSFPSATGRTYTLWRSDTLANGTWTNTGLPALAGTGDTLTFTVPAPTAGVLKRFFRVHAGP